MLAAVAFSLFSSSSEEDLRDEAQKKEDDIILLLKKAKLSMYRGQLQAASDFLHQAIALAHQTHNTQAIIYTYSLMANLAYVQGQLDNAEKLFKAAMSFILSGGTPQDDNSVIEISLKLATIYASQNKTELAEHGYRFCSESLQAKLDKLATIPAEQRSEEEELRKETRLLLGLCLDSRARYRASAHRLSQAAQDYGHALRICREEQGETHPQTLVLMSDLATILDLQGRYDEALPLIQRAMELSRIAGHPDQHVLLGNMAGILLHQGELEESERLYREARSLAEAVGDQDALQQIRDGLKEVGKRRHEQKNKEYAARE
ncbi:tetratricopeptide repeat protein 19, mitochondrial [Lampris incognitus]|uniref:tetratricopeptide repeat protein 19, mitochondrial n=1 Tax=Lampris incognitus TaxID=2546036 RepID=UPI0024B58C8D|nr:tetratricopeptide repeat protein 19, mitochondrial [Lampris incognitus]